MTEMTIPATVEVDEITYRPAASAICSVGHAPFTGVFEITYRPVDRWLEFEAFEEWLLEVSQQKTTIEGLAALVFDKLLEVLGAHVTLSVAFHAQTQVHAPVTVRSSNKTEE